jgi:hypothetical protein
VQTVVATSRGQSTTEIPRSAAAVLVAALREVATTSNPAARSRSARFLPISPRPITPTTALTRPTLH